MIRTLIHIDPARCNGCGACAAACHEGAIGLRDGKAVLLREDYCDGLGDCLPACPTGAISFTRREAPAYDAQAVRAAQIARADAASTAPDEAPSHLAQWPCQLKLVPVCAPYFASADLLIAADCTAYAYARMHEDFMRGRVTLIGCPKLDAVNYADKLTELIRQNTLRSITVVRMEVPCCGGLEFAVRTALDAAGSSLPCRVITITADGRLLNA